MFFVFVTVSFCCKTPGFARRSKGCAGSPSLSMVCLCFCYCFVCLLVGRLVLSFSGVRSFCSGCFFCLLALPRLSLSLVLGVRGGFFLFFLLVSNVCVRVPQGKPRSCT